MTYAPPYALILLGGVSLREGKRELDHVLVNAKAIGLLAYLALSTVGRFVRRDTLVGLLWPELTQARARTALRKTVHLVRHAMSAEALISRGDEDIALSPSVVWCDAVAFAEAVDGGALASALQLYGGELLPGFHLAGCWEFDNWLEAARVDARERASAVAWALARRFETDHNLSDAAGMARRSVRFSWNDERALRRAVTMLDRLGDRAGALSLFEDFASRLRLELNAEPSPETFELITRVRSRVHI